MMRPLLFLWLLIVAAVTTGQDVDQTCVNKDCAPNKSLQSMTFNVGHGNETAWVFDSPDVSTFYQAPPGSRKIVTPRFNGMAAKFINISPNPVTVLWDPADGKRDKSYIADIGPFEAAATAAYPTHVFVMTPKNDPNTILTSFTVKSDEMLYVYDPIQDPTTLSNDELQRYTLQKENLDFAAAYRHSTGRDWLALFRKRERPRFMWDADYFGQQHVVTTPETHFTSFPPENDLTPVSMGESRRLQEYRSPDTPELNLTLTVLSCEPRVFEIKNFLSEVEVDHILELATGMKLKRSMTQAGTSAKQTTSETTRTSRNTWVPRQKSPVIDAIYRRAADLLQLDEALLRRRSEDEFPDLNTKGSIAEDLQLVHYDVSQQYTPHHDWSIPNSQSVGQPSRFATILLYLNGGDGDDLEGGETAFPKWKNAETVGQLNVKPEAGKVRL